jgi:WD40 repeat protein
MTSIFISYSSKNVKIAESIHKFLQDHGFDVWRDKSKIRKDWSKEIAEALSKQDVSLVIWSEDSSNSQWVKNEWITARALGKPIVLVVMAALEKLPLPLRNLDAIVIKNNNINADNKQQVIKKIRDTTKNIQYDYKILPPNRNIPYDPNPDFEGRNTELVDLYLEVLGDLSKLNYSKVGLVGIGGVGKTQLAIEFAYRFGYAFERGIFWIQGTDHASWVSQIVNIAKYQLELKIPNPDVNSSTDDRDKQYFIEFKKYCGKNGNKMLLVIDNVIDPLDLYKDEILFPGDLAAKFTVLTLGCNLLFTTRRDFENRLPNTIQHELKMLLSDAAYLLLTRYRKPDSKEEEEFTKKICNSVGNLPLAIVLIGSYLRKYSNISIEDYYDEHIKNRLSSIDLDVISHDELATRHEAAVRITFDPEWKILKEVRGKPVEIERNQNAEKLVSILSLLSESAIIPKNRLTVYSGIEKYSKTKLIRPAESAFIFLDELNLIDVLENGKSVRIHPLLRDYVREKLEEESTENRSTNLKVESILNLKREYYDNFPSLVQEYVERNNDIDSIREDFETVLLWVKEFASANSASLVKIAESEINPIYELNKIINQELHNLRPTSTNDSFTLNPDIRNLFAQAVLIRSIDLNLMELATKSREYLIQLKKPFLDIKWARVRSSRALIRTLEGHSSSINSIAITSDNSKIVSGGGDNMIKVWDMDTGKLLNTLNGHSDSVRSVSITSDNSKIVSGSWDKTIKIWDLNTGKLLNTLEDNSVYSVAITSDNSKIVSGSWDKTIKIWDLNTGKLLNTLNGHSGEVMSVAITADNSRIVSGSRDGTIKVWELDTGKLLNTLESHSWSGISSVAITSDNSKIVSGSGDKTIRVWELDTGKLLNTLESHSDVNSVAITTDNTKIVSGSFDSTIKVWELDTGKLLNTLGGHSSTVESVAITSDNRKIVSGGGHNDRTIKVWELDTGKLLNTLRGHSERVSSVAITSDNTKIVSGSWDNTIKVWELDTGKLLNTLEGHFYYVESVAITSDNIKVVSGSHDGTIKVWELDTGKLLNALSGHSYGVDSVAITSDNSKIVSGSAYETIIWELDTGKLLNTLESHSRSVAITTDNTKIVSGCYGGTIKVWELDTGKLLNTLSGHSYGVDSVAITSDNSKIVSGGGDSTIKVWDLDTGKLLNTLMGHSYDVNSVAITSDNSKIVSGSDDKTIKVWDLHKGKYYFSDRFDAWISSVAFSKSRNLITLGDSAGNLYAGTLIM